MTNFYAVSKKLAAVPVKLRCVFILFLCLMASALSAQRSVTICPGNTATFTVTDQDPNATIYWFGAGDLNNSIAQGTSFTTPQFNTPGYYNYNYEVVGTDGKVFVFPADLTIRAPLDSTFTTLNGSCLNTPVTISGNANAQDPFGNAFLGDGSTTGASNTNGNVSQAIDSITVEAWVKWTGTQDGWIFFNGNRASNGYGMYVQKSSGNLMLYIGGQAGYNTNVKLTPNVWQHVALIRGYSMWNIVVNSTITNTGLTNTPAAPAGGGFFVGWSGVAGDAIFAGSIDEVGVCNIPKNESVVNYDGQGGISNAVGYWSFNEASGKAADISGGHPLTFRTTAQTRTYSTAYNWNFGGTPLTSGASPSFTFTSNGNKTISLKVTDIYGCNSGTTSQVVNVNNSIPAGVTATTTATDTICPGTPIQLIGSGKASLVNEQFNTNQIPAGWSAPGWQTGSTLYFATYDNSNVISVRGWGDPENTALTTPQLSTTGLTGVSVVLNHFINPGYTYSAWLQASTDNVNWTNVYQFPAGEYGYGHAADFANDNITLPSQFNNQPTLWVRFKWDDAGSPGAAWLINYVEIYSGPVQPQFVWTSNPSGFNSTVQSPENVMPLVTTTYSVVQNTGCSSAPASVTVNVHQDPKVTVSANQLWGCQGGTSPVVTFTGAVVPGGYTVTYAINEGPEFNATASANGMATVAVPTNSAGRYVYRIHHVSFGQGCTTTQSDSVVVIVSMPTASVSALSAISCSTRPADIKFSAANGVAPYTIYYNDQNNSPQTITANDSTATVKAYSATPGNKTYTVTKVADVNGCQQVQNIVATTYASVIAIAAVAPVASVPQNAPSFTLPTVTPNPEMLDSVASWEIDPVAPNPDQFVTAAGTYPNITVPLPNQSPTGSPFNLTVKLINKSGCASPAAPIALHIGSANNNLSALAIQNATLSPSFNPATTYYALTQPYGSAQTSLSLQRADPTELITITINGSVVNDPSVIAVPQGESTIIVTVTAQDGTVKNYTVDIVRSQPDYNSSITTAVAYSLKRIFLPFKHAAITPPSAVSGFANSSSPVIRVRRSQDNALLDIGVDGINELDTATLKNFVGSGNGYVTIWYDQSGNSRDASQTDVTKQPRVVTNGVIERKNGYPTVYFNGTNATSVYLNTAGFTAFSSGFSMFVMAGVKTNSFGVPNTLVNKNTGQFGTPWLNLVNFIVGNSTSNASSVAPITPFVQATPFSSWCFTSAPNSTTDLYNGLVTNGSAGSNSAFADSGAPLIVGSANNASAYLDGWISEIVIYPSKLADADRASATNVQNGKYGFQSIVKAVTGNPTYNSTITIGGSHLIGSTGVSFGGVPATSFNVLNDSTITAVISSGASGSVLVTAPGGNAVKNNFGYSTKPGNAAFYNTGSQSIAVTPTSAVSGSYTVEAWVEPSSGNNSTIFSTRNGGEESFDFKITGFNTIHGDIGNGSAWLSTNADASFAYQANRWFHIAYTVTPTGYTIYANGDKVGQGTFTTPGTPLLYDAAHTITIGSNSSSLGEYFYGAIDEVRVYNAALTQAEVQADMRQTAVARTPNIKNYFNFNQTQVNLLDMADTATGILIGTPTFKGSYAFMSPTAQTATNITATGFTATWFPPTADTVSSFYLDVATNASFTAFANGFNGKLFTAKSVNVAGLTAGTAYWYRVRPYITGDAAAEAPASNIIAIPLITSFTPQQLTSGTVTITGVNLTGATAVTFGGVPAASFTVVDDATITADIGSGVSGIISVTTPGGVATKGGLLIGSGPGTAINFATTGQYATVPVNKNLLSSFSVEAWVKPSSNSLCSILSTRVPGTNYMFDMKLQNGNQALADIGNAFGWISTNATGSINYELGRWYHIAYVVNSTGYNVYVNGNLAGSGSWQPNTPVLFQQGGTLTIGANSGGAELFQGAVDEVRMYNTTITQDQIRFDMRNKASALPAQLVTYYNFDNPGDVVLHDQIGTMNGNVLGNAASIESYAMVIPYAAASNIISTGFTVKWPTPIGIVNNYVVDLSTTANFSAIVSGYNSKVVNDTSIIIAGLDSTQRYWFRVRAVKTDLGDVGAYCTIALPGINSFTPSSTLGGGTVVIKGTNLTGASAISFGGTAATSFTVNNDSTITAIVGNGSSGVVSVTVPGGTITKNGFVYGSAPGYALRFTASTSQTVNSASLASASAKGNITGSYTVEAWFKPEQYLGDAVLFSTRTPQYAQYDYSFDIHILNNGMVHANIGTGTYWLTNNADAAYKFDTGRWYHIAYAVTPAGYNIYINGDSASSGTFGDGGTTPMLYITNNRAIFIGSQNDANGFTGLMDEVRIYNTAITQANVRADIQNIAPSVPSSLKDYYNFDQLGGTTLTDVAGSNNLSLTGTAWVTSYAMAVPATTGATNVSLTGFTANWLPNQVGNSNNYFLDIATTPDFSTPLTGYNAKNVATNTTQALTGLTPGKTYWYRVRCNSTSPDVVGTGANSNVMAVTLPALNPLDKVGLDSTSFASPAYSLRLLSSIYTGKAINVRRSSDNGTQDIGFTANGDLDTTALSTFVGSNVGYVVIWYDQSGWGYNATQVTDITKQPRIINNGAMERLYGRPAVYFDHPNNLATAQVTIFTAGASMVGVAKGNGSTPSALVTKTGTAAGANLPYPGPFDFTNYNGQATVGDASTPTFAEYDLNTTSPPSLVGVNVPESVYGFVIPTVGNFSTYLNGVQKSSTPVNAYADNGNPLMMGNRNSGDNSGYLWVPEIILFNGVLADSNRNKVEKAQTDYYINNNATLSALTISTGALAPGFTAATTAYTAAVVPTTANVTVTPTVAIASSTVQVKINTGSYVTVTSGTPSAALPLNTGSNTITLLVTTQTGATNTYTITLTKAAANVLDKTGLGSSTLSSPAYSLRLLSSSYTGKAVTVRRSSDNTMQDIGFTTKGDFDTTALKTFAGSDTGYVAKWYDQSGFGYDMQQNVTAQQPYIIYGGIVERIYDKPAVYFGTANLATNTVTMFTTAASMVGVAKGNSTTPSAFITKTGDTAGFNASFPAPFEYSNISGQFTEGNSALGQFTTSQLSATTPVAVVSSQVPASVYGFVIPSAGNYYTDLNGIVTDSQQVTAFGDNGGPLMIGNKNSLGSSGNVWVPEAILFNSVLSTADRKLVETSQNNYYINSDTTLASLTTSAGGLSPVFTPSTKIDTISVTAAATSLTVTPTANSTNATVQISLNGGPYTIVPRGSASASLSLTPGSNDVISILVTAVTGATGTYTITVVKVASITWAGIISTDWKTAANWNTNVVPLSTDNVIIPAGTLYSPIITTSASITNITISAGASLTVNGTVNIAGNVTNNGLFDVSAGNLEFNRNNPSPQLVYGDITAKNIYLVNRSKVDLESGTTRLLGTLSVGQLAGPLYSNSNLVLASTANGAASVAQTAASNYVVGNVVVERYIPAHRAWRLLTAPLGNTGSIYKNWQNNGVATDTTGVLIFSPGGTGNSGNGLTAGGGEASIEGYDPVVNNWVPLSNTTSTLLSGTATSAANTAYSLFVTGPYGSNNILPATGAAATTIRATGTLQTGTQQFNYTGLAASTYMLVGNPYASPVNFTQVGVRGLANGNITGTMWAWDAARSNTSYGGYVTFSWDKTSGSYDQDISADSTMQTVNIQSGEAFFVQAAANGNATVTIAESDKAAASTVTGGVFGVQQPTTPAQQVRISLNSPQGQVDGVLAKFGEAYKTGVSDDADKLFNYDENLSLRIDTNYLAIERRPMPVAGDTMYLDAYAMKKNTAYSFTVSPENMPTGLQALLVDAYAKTKTPLSMTDGTSVSFNTGTDAASLSETRFVIVFQTNGVLATATTLKAVEAGKAVQVEWVIPNELGVKQYHVQRSTDAQNFTTINTSAARNSGNKEEYDFTDEQPNAGDNYYRIEIFNADGSTSYSNVVLVKMAKGEASFSIYPNPTARNGQLHVRFTNMAAGRYALVLYSTSGKQLMDETILLDGTPTLQTINLPQGIAGGNYRLVLLDGKDGEWEQQLVVQ